MDIRQIIPVRPGGNTHVWVTDIFAVAKYRRVTVEGNTARTPSTSRGSREFFRLCRGSLFFFRVSHELARSLAHQPVLAIDKNVSYRILYRSHSLPRYFRRLYYITHNASPCARACACKRSRLFRKLMKRGIFRGEILFSVIMSAPRKMFSR